MAACLGGIAYTFVSVSVIGETADVAAMGREKDINTLTGRLPLWEQAWKDAQHRPWMGHGFGAYWNAKNVLEYSDQFSWHIPHAHNAYIDLTLAIGGMGLAFYVLWVGSSATAAFARYERSGRPAELFVTCYLLMTLVHGATESKIPGAGVGALVQLAVMAALILHLPWQPRAAAPASAVGRAQPRSILRPRPHVPPRISRRLEGSA
jgi:O-antigen ligase